MKPWVIVRGDDSAIVATLTRSGALCDCSGGSLRLSVRDSAGTTQAADLSPARAGAAWASGVVVAVLPRALTALLATGQASAQIRATLGGEIITWRLEQVLVVEGL